jgi:hypothetical protein
MLASLFVCKEVDQNTVVLDSAVDHEDAFNMFVEFLYMASYIPPEELDLAARCILHARVYVLAERLCMNDLKEMAFAQMKASLAESYGLTVARSRQANVIDCGSTAYSIFLPEERPNTYRY